MNFSRRNLMKGVALSAITLAFRGEALAVPPKPLSLTSSSGSSGTSGSLAAAKRSSININLLNVFEYAFIDHCKQADNFLGPVGTNYATSSTPWTQTIDSNGWPNNSFANGRAFGGGVRIPGPDQFAGPYVITWEGAGSVQIIANGITWTEVSGGSGFTKIGNGSWSNVSGQKARVVVKPIGVSGPQLLGLSVFATGGLGGFLKNLKFYRLEDEADLLAGKIFRRGFKQIYVDYNPSLIRFMDWNMVNGSLLSRFEQRNIPSGANYANNWTVGPRYGTTAGVNRMTLASASDMPSAMKHGEVVTCRIGAGLARADAKTVSNISQANPGVVTASGHGFNTGDVIIHQMMGGIPGETPVGMVQLNNTPCTVTVIDANNYSIGIDTTSYSKFTLGTAYQYVTLNVGGRGEYPVMYVDGVSPASRFGAAYIAAGDYKSFSFDKDIVASTKVKGAWLFSNIGESVIQGGVPLEICTALVNELMAMTSSGPIDMWVCIPHRGMISSDQDYSPASNWPVNMVKTILEGANGFAGLDSRCKLYVEHSNETWNSGFMHTNFMKKLGYQRWPASGPWDVSSYSTLRAVLSMEEIKAAFPGNSRIKYVMAGQGAVGSTHVTNSYRISGSVYFNSDVLNTWRTEPISHFDYFSWAAYFYNPDDGSSAASSLGAATKAWIAAGANTTAQESAYAAYVAGIVGTGSGETISRYLQILLPDYANAMAAKGKKTIMYEGGWDHGVTGYAPDQNAFLAACKRSAAWAKALRTFHDGFNSVSAAECPAEYVMVGDRWGHTPTDTYLGGVEGANLDLAWQSLAARNKGVAAN